MMQGWLVSRSMAADPLAADALDGAVGEPVGARHFFPYQKTELVGPVVIARILDLLVLPHAIEPHRLRKLHVATQRIVFRRRQPALGPVPLIEDHAENVRAAVEHETVAVHVNRAKRGVARDFVEEIPPVCPQLELNIDKRWCCGIPQQSVSVVVYSGIRQCNPPMDLAGNHRICVIGEQHVARPKLHAELQRLPAHPAQPGLESELPAFEIRRPSDALDPGGRHCFEPYRLPYTCRSRIPDGMWFELPVLFSARLRKVAGIVFGAHDDCEGRQSGEASQIDRERRVAALVRSRLVPVDPDGGTVVDGAEVQEQATLGWRRGHIDRAPVPTRAKEQIVADAARLRLRGEGNFYCPGPFDFVGVAPAGIGV